MGRRDRANLERLLRSAWERQTALTSEPNRKKGRHDTPLFLAVISMLAIPLVYLLQANGVVEIKWVPSLSFYTLILVIFIWEFFRWDKPARWNRGWRATVCIVICAVVAGVSGTGVYLQYRKEHVGSSISIRASLSPAHKDGENLYGITWKNGFQDLRLVVQNLTEYPVHNLDLTVRVLDKSDDALLGMGQVSDLAGVEFHAPEWSAPDLLLKGMDGQVYTEHIGDLFHPSFGGYWKTFCPKVSAGLPLRLAIAAMGNKAGTTPKRLRVLGSYEAVSKEGSKFVTFNGMIDVVR